MSDAFLQQCLPKDVKPGLKRVSRKYNYLDKFIIHWLISDSFFGQKARNVQEESGISRKSEIAKIGEAN